MFLDKLRGFFFFLNNNKVVLETKVVFKLIFRLKKADKRIVTLKK